MVRLSNLVLARVLQGKWVVSFPIISLLFICLIGLSYFTCQGAVRVTLTLNKDLILNFGLIHSWLINLGLASRIGLIRVALHFYRFCWRRNASFVFWSHDFVDDKKLVNFWGFHFLCVMLVLAVILDFICRAICSFQVSYKTIVLWLRDSFLVLVIPALIGLQVFGEGTIPRRHESAIFLNLIIWFKFNLGFINDRWCVS